MYVYISFRYGEVRTKLDEVFGPKIHKDFFRKYVAEAGECGSGFYVSKIKDDSIPGVGLTSNVTKVS